MKKGLRPAKELWASPYAGLNECPDEEGITTPTVALNLPSTVRLNECPDEEGITTQVEGVVDLLPCLNECPDEEGITTR